MGARIWSTGKGENSIGGRGAERNERADVGGKGGAIPSPVDGGKSLRPSRRQDAPRRECMAAPRKGEVA